MHSPPLETLMRAVQDGWLTTEGKPTEKALERAEQLATAASKGLSSGGCEYVMRETLRYIQRTPTANRKSIEFCAKRARGQWLGAMECLTHEQSGHAAPMEETTYAYNSSTTL